MMIVHNDISQLLQMPLEKTKGTMKIHTSNVIENCVLVHDDTI